MKALCWFAAGGFAGLIILTSLGYWQGELSVVAEIVLGLAGLCGIVIFVRTTAIRKRKRMTG